MVKLVPSLERKYLGVTPFAHRIMHTCDIINDISQHNTIRITYTNIILIWSCWLCCLWVKQDDVVKMWHDGTCITVITRIKVMARSMPGDVQSRHLRVHRHNHHEDEVFGLGLSKFTRNDQPNKTSMAPSPSIPKYKWQPSRFPQRWSQIDSQKRWDPEACSHVRMFIDALHGSVYYDRVTSIHLSLVTADLSWLSAPQTQISSKMREPETHT